MEMIMRSIAIISVFYNRCELVDDCCRSIIENMGFNSTLYLVDDGSTDSTLNELKKFESDRVVIIDKENTGFVDSIIKVIDSTVEPFIAIHGSGDLALSDRFNKQYKFLSEHSDYALCGSLMELEYPNHDRVIHISGQHFDGDASDEIIKRSVVTHGEVMFTRRHYDLVGGYRYYFKFAQDRDLWCRLSRVGKFKVLDEVLYKKLCCIPGSVSGTPDKIVIQQSLSYFAIWCHEVFISKGYDPLDKYEIHAALIRKRYFKLELSYLKLFFKSLCLNDDSHSNMYLDFAKRESTLFLSKIIAVIYNASPFLVKYAARFYAKSKGIL